MSLQFYGATPLMHDAVRYAHASGVVLVAAAGNGGPMVARPAAFDETIAVAALTNVDQRWSLSNMGPELTVSAPGSNIWDHGTPTNSPSAIAPASSAPFRRRRCWAPC